GVVTDDLAVLDVLERGVACLGGDHDLLFLLDVVEEPRAAVPRDQPHYGGGDEEGDRGAGVDAESAGHHVPPLGDERNAATTSRVVVRRAKTCPRQRSAAAWRARLVAATPSLTMNTRESRQRARWAGAVTQTSVHNPPPTSQPISSDRRRPWRAGSLHA